MTNLDLLEPEADNVVTVPPLADGVVLVQDGDDEFRVPIFTLSPSTAGIIERRAKAMSTAYHGFCRELERMSRQTMFWSLRSGFRNSGIFFFSDATKAEHPTLATVGVVFAQVMSTMNKIVKSVRMAEETEGFASLNRIEDAIFFLTVQETKFYESLGAVKTVLDQYYAAGAAASGPVPSVPLNRAGIGGA